MKGLVAILILLIGIVSPMPTPAQPTTPMACAAEEVCGPAFCMEVTLPSAFFRLDRAGDDYVATDMAGRALPVGYFASAERAETALAAHALAGARAPAVRSARFGATSGARGAALVAAGC